MIVLNKWNNKVYEVISQDENKVELRRCADNSCFTIAKSEYAFSYKPFQIKN